MAAATISYEQLLDWLRLVDEGIIEQRGYLTELDSAIGDGDHGTNLSRGSTAISARVDSEKPEYLDELFRMVGMALISTVGGASGPLYGTFFLRMSLTIGHRQEVSPELLADALEAGVAGVVERGKPELGDKTMYDALEPAVRAFRQHLREGIAAASQAAATAAAAGMDSTADLVARKGRASYLGERSVGHIDPGAASSALMFSALAEALA
ncbi:MAG TPA: dihydroxyacetone kinase subunit DhaL [Galbitalea sp.]|jgi:dihydroxyacetone kinase-like protein|nr:dihydroxyacetone kinase subunit DhaL [Galbitalea sp.]